MRRRLSARNSPGPWTATDEGYTEEGPTRTVCWKIHDANGRLVATGRSELRGDAAAERRAAGNARLMALSLEMSAVLGGLLGTWKAPTDPIDDLVAEAFFGEATSLLQRLDG